MPSHTSIQPTRTPNAIAAIVFIPFSLVAYLGWCAGVLPATAHFAGAFLVALLITSLAHDSLHGNVSSFRWFNDSVGWICAFIGFMPYPVFRRAHALHHARPMTRTDPHLWMHRGPAVLLPLRWATANFGYNRVLPQLSTREVAVSCAVLLVHGALVVAWPREVLLGWLLPMQTSTLLFALFTDWLPHGPIGGRAARRRGDLPMRWRLFHHLSIYHQDHHRRPQFPFYQGLGLLDARIEAEVEGRLAPLAPASGRDG
jgi:fatty acid desaturase